MKRRNILSVFLCVVTIFAVFAIGIPTNVIAQCGCKSGALPGVAAYWKFEEGSGTIAYDSTNNHNDGTLNGWASWTTGQVGGALNFIPKPPGPGSWVEVNDDTSLNPTNAITIEAWINTNKMTYEFQTVVDKNYWYSGYYFQVLYNYIKIGVCISGMGWVDKTKSGIQVNTWHHVAGTWDGTSGIMTCYVDGVGHSAGGYTGTMTPSIGTPVRIGSIAGWNGFDGDIDEVTIFERALTDSEILNHYHKSYVGYHYCEFPDIVYVDDDFTPSTPGWWWDHFDNIQEGVAAVANGGTVYVNEGTYYENVVVDKTQTIIGECRDTTIIDGCGSGNVMLITANGVDVSGFTFTNGDYGIFLDSSSNSKINHNTISFNNNYGVYLTSSFSNLIYHNNIIYNNVPYIQAYDDTNNGNQWDNGYPFGGNYWSDFDEPGEGAFDDYQGPNQDQPGSDGIVDKGSVLGGGKNPYIIDVDSQDNYPFINENGWLDLLWRRWYVDMMDVLFPTHVVTANINNAPAGAGDDVVASCFHINTAYGAVVWYDNLGAPSFSNRIYIDDNIRMLGGIAVGDLDNDGYNDVVAVGDESYVYWYENDGSGYFFSKNILDNTLWAPKEVFIADINGDTLPDVVATGADNIQWLGRGQVKWYENLGGGNFVFGGRVIDNLPLAWGLYVAEINGIGGIDVVATSVGETGILDDGTIVWYANDGLGVFTGPYIIDSGRDGCENIFAADIDKDGYTDIVASMSDDNDYCLLWYENDGVGGFSNFYIIDQGLEFNGLDMADISNYCGLDIAIGTSSTGNWVLWYEKPQNPLIDPWTKHIIDDDPYPPPAYAQDVSIAYIDNDIDLDVVGALFWKQAITWYENPLV